eukprot:3261491-Alexandrium_andersonii.AAC.1
MSASNSVCSPGPSPRNSAVSDTPRPPSCPFTEFGELSAPRFRSSKNWEPRFLGVPSSRSFEQA